MKHGIYIALNNSIVYLSCEDMVVGLKAIMQCKGRLILLASEIVNQNILLKLENVVVRACKRKAVLRCTEDGFQTGTGMNRP